MPSLRKSSAFLIASIFIVSCASSKFRVTREFKKDEEVMGAEIMITPDRIVSECEDVSDENDFHGFMIHVLDPKDEVMTFVHTSTFDKKNCLDVQNDVEKLIKKATKLYLVGMGSFKASPDVAGYRVGFPSHGEFATNGVSFQFLILKNDKGGCYGAFTGKEECPRVGVDYFD